MRRWNPFAGTQSPTTTPVPLTVDSPPVVTPPDAKYFGLENFGNTCYANSVLQALYFCGPFRDFVLQYPDLSVPDLPPPVPTPVSPPPPPPTFQRPRTARKASISDSPHPGLSSQAATTGPNANAGTSVQTPIPIPSSPPTLLSALRSLYLHISRNPADKGTVAPRAFIDKLKELNDFFRPAQHQDAHEFLNFMLNKIVEEMDEDRRNGVVVASSGFTTASNPSKEDLSQSISTLNSSVTAPPASTVSASTSHPTLSSTFVHRLFEGVLTSETRCLTCETVSSRDESFLDLSIDIEQNSSVTACLRQFSASEMLCQKNKFFCDSCCDLQEAEKRMKIKKLPNVLALHLKRFKYQEDTGRYIKLAYRVAFPFQLRLFNTVDDADNPDRLYELFAIVIHIGTGPHHGHYVSIIKARGTWYLFDDENVDAIKECDIVKYYGDNNGSAYVLYYQAADLDVTALGLRPPPGAAPQSTNPPRDTPSAAQSIAVSVGTSLEEANLPALPPGLVQPKYSDEKEPAPATPVTPTSPLASPRTQSPNLSVTIPPNSTESNPSTPTAPATPGTLNTLFNTLRHSPSGKIRRHVLDTKSEPPPPLPTPSTSTSTSSINPGATASSSVTDTSSSSSPPPPPLKLPNGKEKEREPERKPSGWFSRRRSVRDEKVKGAPSSFPSLGKDKDDGSSTPNWLKHAGRLGRRASEVGFHDSNTPSSPRALSPPSTAPLPSVPFNSSPLHSLPDHKKSTPELSNGRRRLPQRPSTAGASIGSRPRSAAAPPLPPLPNSPTSSNGQQRSSPIPNDIPSSPRDRRPNGTIHSFEVRRLARPQSSSSAMIPGLGFSSTSNGTSSTLNTSSHSGDGSSTSTGDHPPTVNTNRKRSSRKLSFTAPILGFGRKDRDKTKDKAKDLHVSSPPSTYPSGAQIQ